MRDELLGLALLAFASAHCGGDDSAVTMDASTDDVTSPPDSGALDASKQADSGGAQDAAPVDPCAGRIVCDDFEKAATGGPPGSQWTLSTSKGTVVIDETRAHSGKRSAKVSIDATTSSDTYRQAMLTVAKAPLIPLPANTVYGRFMISTDRIPDSTVHWTIASASGQTTDNLYAVYNYGGMGGLMANYYKSTTPNPTDCWQSNSQAFPTGAKWTCVAFQLDGTNDEMRYWIDGVEITDLHVIGMSKTDATCTVKGVDGRWLAPTFDSVRVGWESYQDDKAGAHVAWIDDVILDDNPVSCP